MMRSSVVLPEPEGPSSATSSPAGMSRLRSSQTTVAPKRFCRWRTSMLIGAPRRAGDAADAALDEVLERERHQRQHGEQRRDRERRRELVFVVEDLDVQRHGVGLAADVAGDDADRAELAHRPRVAEDDAVEQRPLDVRQRDAAEDLPAAGAEHARRFFLLGALRLHQRDQLAGDEREGDEDRREDDARQGEDDLQVVVAQPGAEPALQAEHQHEDQAGDHRADRERQVDQGEQQVLAAEVELGDRPRRGEAEDEVERHRDGRGDQRQLDRRDRVGLADRGEVDVDALLQRLDEHRDAAARTGRRRGTRARRRSGAGAPRPARGSRR